MPDNSKYLEKLDEALEKFRNGTGPLPQIRSRRRPPVKRPQSEIDADTIVIRKKYIRDAVELKVKAVAATTEVETAKATLTPEELQVEERRVKAELVRAEKQYYTMLEEERPTAEEIRTAKQEIAEGKA